MESERELSCPEALCINLAWNMYDSEDLLDADFQTCFNWALAELMKFERLLLPTTRPSTSQKSVEEVLLIQGLVFGAQMSRDLGTAGESPKDQPLACKDVEIGDTAKDTWRVSRGCRVRDTFETTRV